MPFTTRLRSICWLAVAAAICVFCTPGNSQLMRPLRMDKSGINPIPESATSFDCTKAKLPVEQLICHDYILAMADGEMGEQLWFMKRELTTQQWNDVIHSQRAWLQRRNACHDSKCVETAYEQRSRELDKIWDAREQYLRRNVSRVGQCEKAKVEWIGPRLRTWKATRPMERASDSLTQCAKSRMTASSQVLASRVGDPARVCLMEIPTGCPPGDNRGRVYRVTNLRTGKTWELPDSSHGCGGA